MEQDKQTVISYKDFDPSKIKFVITSTYCQVSEKNCHASSMTQTPQSYYLSLTPVAQSQRYSIARKAAFH